jgi:transmembrane sensor
MTQHDQDEVRRAREAAEWLVRIQDPEARDQEAFSSWIMESASHVKEYLGVSCTARALERVDPRREIDVEKLIDQVKAQAVPLALRSAHRLVPAPGEGRAARPPHRSRAVRYWSFAGIAAALLAAVVFWTTFMRGGAQIYETAVGELHSIKLDDGSVIDLNTNSRVAVRYSRSTRNVTLLRGQALFSIAHVPSRPFYVRTDQALIRAVGTQFDVHQQAAQTVVSVVEGEIKVLLSQRGRSVPGPFRSWREATAIQTEGVPVSAGEQAEIGLNGHISKRTPPDIMNATKWRERRLPFDDVALADVVEEFNRYNTFKIRVEGEELRTLLVSGIFSPDRPENLFEYLQKVDARISIDKTTDGFVVRFR